MGETLVVSLIICAVSVILWAVKVLYTIWWTPKKLESALRKQGIEGPAYKLFFGNMKENFGMVKEAQSKPINLSHNIAPRILPFALQTVEKYGKLSVIWYGAIPRVTIMEPDLIRDVLSNKFGHFPKSKSNPLVRYFATGLASYHGEQWAKHRRILNPAFHQEKLKRMLPAFYTSCSELVSKWDTLITAEEGSCELDVWPELQNLTGDVISRTAFGSSFEEGRCIFQLQTEQAKLAIQAIQSVYIPGSRFLPTKRNTRMKEIDKEIRSLLTDIIYKREQAIKAGEASNGDLLGLMMESNFKEIKKNNGSKKLGMSLHEIIEECKLFYFAGQETTSTLLVWTMVALSMHPEWQVLAREEVLQIFERRAPEFDELTHLKIVPMILYEVLRLYPPIVLLTRRTDKEMKLGKIILPAGVQVALPILFIHHDHEIWGEDVDEFNPKRFCKGVSNATKNQVSFFPFGWGPRICIGQNFALVEAKMALTMILQHFSFELSPTYAHAPYTVITIQPQHGAQIILRKI
ncbi:hypothetical protein GIB67_025405 [Kingdonia uniflora]|uniref:Cytochrome P450 n=1 Tax=Kingdonia uniflora TaxID=39325 RepID=A0A7J7NBE2_9MAGN|nr:hypothetical protein GIB67_025405 [Kingdonia uniflora]